MSLVDWIWNRTAAIASPLVFAVLFVVALIFIFVLFPLTNRHWKGKTTFDSDRWGFAPSDAPRILGQFTNEQLRIYRKQELMTDLLFPIVYGVGFAVAMVLLVNITGAPRWLVLLPYGAAIADFFENFSVVCMIDRHLKGQTPGAFAVVGSIASRLKHGLLTVTILVLIGLGAWGVWRKYR
jgi:hypothetical protein